MLGIATSSTAAAGGRPVYARSAEQVSEGTARQFVGPRPGRPAIEGGCLHPRLLNCSAQRPPELRHFLRSDISSPNLRATPMVARDRRRAHRRQHPARQHRHAHPSRVRCPSSKPRRRPLVLGADGADDDLGRKPDALERRARSSGSGTGTAGNHRATLTARRDPPPMQPVPPREAFELAFRRRSS